MNPSQHLVALEVLHMFLTVPTAEYPMFAADQRNKGPSL
jgi:hypothetical protein